MRDAIPGALLAALLIPGAVLARGAQGEAYPPPQRGGFAAQFEYAGGGDNLFNEEIHASRTQLGEGPTFSLGGFYHPVDSSPWEVEGFVGYKLALLVPGEDGDDDANITRWVFQLLGNYRTADKWFAGGGLVYHLNPRYYDNFPGALDVDFENAVGATVQAGWSWFAVQYTYMKYSSVYGDFDASNYGIRFTWRFVKPQRRTRAAN